METYPVLNNIPKKLRPAVKRTWRDADGYWAELSAVLSARCRVYVIHAKTRRRLIEILHTIHCAG